MTLASFKTMGLVLALSASMFVATSPSVFAAESAAKMTIPATSDAIWKAIDAQSAELKKTIDGGALEEVHHHAFAIRDLAAALPERSAGMAADKLGKVKGGVKFVATLAQRLDASGDAKDAAGTRQNYAKLLTVLESMRANYPTSK